MLKVAIFGAATALLPEGVSEVSRQVGMLLGSQGFNVATGGCIGVPSLVARAAKRAGSRLEAFFPDISTDQVIASCVAHNNDTELAYDKNHYSDGFTERSLALIRAADLAVMLYGGVGTLSEWSMAVEEGLPVIVLRSGGTTELVEEVLRYSHRVPSPSRHRVVHSMEELEIALNSFK